MAISKNPSRWPGGWMRRVSPINVRTSAKWAHIGDTVVAGPDTEVSHPLLEEVRRHGG